MPIDTLSRRPYRLWAVLVAASILALLGFNLTDKASALEGSGAPLVGSGHGVFIDARRQVVSPGPELVLETQHHHLQRLLSAANPAQREAYAVLDRELRAIAGTGSAAEQILLEAARLSWLLVSVKHDNPAHLGSLHTALWGLVRADVGKGGAADPRFVVAGRFYEELMPKIRLSAMYAPPVGGSDYVDECKRAGVPIPPDWGSPLWQGPRPLSTNFLQGNTSGVADMYVYEDPAGLGMCAALPRHDGTTIGALGVICMGVKSSKTCYWDNQQNKLSFDIPVGTPKSIVKEFAGGADLYKGSGGVCTDCHAGENPYIVHPADPAMVFSRAQPAHWNQPLVHPAWPQNRGPNNTLTPPGKSCVFCHQRPGGVGQRLPVVSTETPRYCDLVLPMAFSTTMPSAGNPAPYQAQFDALRAQCQKPPPGDGTVVVNGGITGVVTGGRSDTTGTLGGGCVPGSVGCPYGFCYWRSVHGPFWQTSPAGLRPEDPAFRGSFLHIFVQNGYWNWRAFSDSTGLPPQAPPGGVAECVALERLAGVVNPASMSNVPHQVSDPAGALQFQSIDVAPGALATSVAPLTGLLGNVAHVFEDRESDRLQVRVTQGQRQMEHRHRLTATGPYPTGPAAGETWTIGSQGWAPVWLVQDKLSTGDVELVPAARADKARCFITGVEGAWSSSRQQGSQQPYAHIVRAPSGELRLQVWPYSGKDSVAAYASCIELK